MAVFAFSVFQSHVIVNMVQLTCSTFYSHILSFNLHLLLFNLHVVFFSRACSLVSASVVTLCCFEAVLWFHHVVRFWTGFAMGTGMVVAFANNIFMGEIKPEQFHYKRTKLKP